MKNKIRKYGLFITKTVYYGASCGVVVGLVLEAMVDWGSDPAGALHELPPKGPDKHPTVLITSATTAPPTIQ